MKKSMRLVACMLMACVAMLGVFAQGASEGSGATGTAAPARTKIKIAYHPHVTGAGAVLNALDNGYFDQENLDVELVQFTSGATELAAMASGDIDLGYLGVGAHVFAPKGQCVILALDSTDISGEILVRADSGIKSMKDLKGKNVAISAGTTSELVLSMALQLNQMQKSDVNMINMDASAKVTAFMTGKIDAISIEAPYTDQIRKDMGADKVLTLSSSKDFLPDAVFTNSWVTTSKFLNKNENVVVRFLRAYLKGSQDRYDHMEDTVKKVAKFINTDEATAALVVTKTNWLSNSELTRLVDDGTAMKWYGIINKMFLDAGLLDPKFDVDPSTYVKFDYLKQAMKDNGVN